MLRFLTAVMLLISRCAAEFRPPHIIFILADDLGWNDISFHGSKQIPTPNIDAFARDGIILNNYYVLPTCTPSRASLMTGKYPIRLGLQHLVILASSPSGIPLRERIMPQFLNELGYVSHGVGKWHLGFYRNEYIPTNRGFQSFFGYWSGVEDYYTHFAQDEDYIGLDLHDNGETTWNYSGQYGTELFTEKAKSIIMNHNASQPLFLFMSHQAVHSGCEYNPLQEPRKYSNRFSYIKDEVRRKFAGVVASLDDSVGELAEALENKGMLDDSLIIFSTDNGGAVRDVDGTSGSNWPLRGGKYTLWEGGVRGVAWIWSSELRKKKRIENGLFHVIDWLPTLYAAAGADPEALKTIDGINQWNTLQGIQNSKRDEILLNIDQVWKTEAILKGHYKLVKGTSYDGMYDGWFDKEGNYIRNFKNELRFSEGCEEMHNRIYRSALLNSKVAKILQKRYEEDSVRVYESQDSLLDRENFCGTLSEAGNCQPAEAPCLFDIQNDPCELRNVADLLPHVVNDLQKRLEKYRNESVEPQDFIRDPAANPKLHGNAWIPWRSVLDDQSRINDAGP